MKALMKEIEAENARLKKMYIEEKLKAEILNEAIPITLACSIFSVSETCYRY